MERQVSHHLCDSEKADSKAEEGGESSSIGETLGDSPMGTKVQPEGLWGCCKVR